MTAGPGRDSGRRPRMMGPEETRAVEQFAGVGAGHAAAALGRLTGTAVSHSPPEVKVLPLQKVSEVLGTSETPVMGVMVPYRGDSEGDFLLLFSEEEARGLEKSLLGPLGTAGAELRESAFRETAGILAGTFLTVLSRLTGQILLPSPPLLARDMAGALLDSLLAEVACDQDQVPILVFRLVGEDGESLLRAFLLPDTGGLGLIIKAARRLSSP